MSSSSGCSSPGQADGHGGRQDGAVVLGLRRLPLLLIKMILPGSDVAVAAAVRADRRQRGGSRDQRPVLRAGGLPHLRCPERGDALASCARCGDHLHSRKPGGLNRTWALLITSVILYVPCQPLSHHGHRVPGDDSPSTIMGRGVALGHGLLPHRRRHLLRQRGGPLVKILALLWLCYVVQRGRGPRRCASSALSHDRICGALVDDRRLRGGHTGRPHPAGQSDDHLSWPAAVALPGRADHHGGRHEFRIPA